MEKEFIGILKMIAEKHGKEQFLDLKKCKAIVSDYAGSEYKNEKGLLFRAVETGVSNAIFCAEKNSLDSCMKVQQRKLQEEQFMDASIAQLVVAVLANVLCDLEIKNVNKDIKSLTDKYNEAMGFFHNNQLDKAKPLLEELVKENHAGAQTYLGIILNSNYSGYNKEGIPQDNAKSIELFKKAAQQNFGPAMFELCNCYCYGWDIPQDAVKAVEWCRKAADQGDAEAQEIYGSFHTDGYGGLPKDETIAFEWYRKSAEQGHRSAQCQMAHCYEDGMGVKEDYKEALIWFHKAAEQGDIHALRCLSERYRYQDDYDKAAECLQKLIKLGDNFAQEGLDALNQDREDGLI